ncbi:hypothetical protein MLD38_007488 [Melastoma candidum]|uniref:Uncharacterized protein n=1 Tax=Melastoma candidum TaxID=119954 RepID=A0ACB9RR01_9MYRT|nr:hypothetical protein MLD38_007488 [Melastoma candidum]
MERAKMEEHMQRELESIKLERESLAVETEQDENNMFENLKIKHIQLLQDIETMKEDFEATLSGRHDDQEKALLVSEEKRREVETETRALKKSKQILEINKKQLKENQQEINKDIDQLMVMSHKHKDQRLHLSRERDDFLLVAKKLRNCDTCGEMIRGFILSDLQMPLTGDEEVLPLEQRVLELSNNLVNKSYLDGSPMQASVDVSPRSFSAGPTSFLRKCASKIFRLLPGERGTVSVSPQQEWMPLAEDKKNPQEHEPVEDKAETSVQIFRDHATVMESSSDKVEGSDRRPTPSVDGGTQFTMAKDGVKSRDSVGILKAPRQAIINRMKAKVKGLLTVLSSSDARAAEDSADLINSGRKETYANGDGKTADGMVEIVPSSSLGVRKRDEDLPSSHDRQARRVEFSEEKVMGFETVDVVERTGDATSEHRNDFDDETNAIEQFPNEDETMLNEDDSYDDDSDEDSAFYSSILMGHRPICGQ